ncbi:DoxX family protein [Mycobacteroides abscessus]|uniref:DoxX family protein n=1 Tax=Mycobacteroides abscessus TaxID=36809 RepID=UPI000C268F2D|nr:DoxX family protein [Mycobacteroides abscessus]
MNETSQQARILTLLATFQAIDAALCVQPIDYVTKCLDTVRFPQQGRWVFPVVKGASAAGLLLGTRVPALAKLTLVMLTFYFSLAVGAHVKARDLSFNALAASSLLAVYAALSVHTLRPTLTAAQRSSRRSDALEGAVSQGV